MHTTIALALLFGSVFFVTLALLIARNRYPAAAVYMVVALLGVGIWYAFAAAEVLWGADPETLTALRSMRYIGVTMVPPGFLLFVLSYAGGIELKRTGIAALFIVPVVSLLLVWTNPLHELMWPHPPHPPFGGAPRPPFGPWFTAIYAPYTYMLMTWAVLVLARQVQRPRILERTQALVLLLAAAVPFVVNAVYVYNPDLPDLQQTPIALGFTALVAAWGWFRFRIFQVSPLALRTVFDEVADAVLVIDGWGRVSDANAAAAELLDTPREALVGQPADAVATSLALPGRAFADVPGRHEGNTPRGRLLQIDVAAVRDGSQRVRGRVITARDVTAQRTAENALRASEEMVRTVLDRSPNGILRFEPYRSDQGRIRDFTCVLANAMAAEYLGLPLERLLMARLTAIDPPHIALLFDLFRRTVDTGRPQERELHSSGPHGDHWFRVMCTPIGADISVTFVDTTEQKQRELRMEAAALEDPLTGLPNRRGFAQDAQAVLTAGCEDEVQRPFALLYIDMDGFKHVNDTYGHAAGDAVLAAFAQRIKRCTRAQDIIGRIGGDEFVVLATDCTEETARELTARIQHAAARPFVIGTNPVQVSCSVGTALLSGRDADLDALLRAGDVAMYENKRTGRNEQWTIGEQNT